MPKIGPGWYGMLTVNNIEQVAEAIRQMLTGKRYTFVAINMYGANNGRLIHKPEVHTGQQLVAAGAVRCWHGNNKAHAGFNVSDSSGVWDCSTNLINNIYDPEFNNPYLVFEWRTITITHQAPAGHLLYWVIAIEDETED